MTHEMPTTMDSCVDAGGRWEPMGMVCMDGHYQGWSDDVWDFGSSSQLPVLLPFVE